MSGLDLKIMILWLYGFYKPPQGPIPGKKAEMVIPLPSTEESVTLL